MSASDSTDGDIESEGTASVLTGEERWDWLMSVKTRWRDVDALGHVHHLAYLRWCEDARNDHAVAIGLPAPGSGACSQVIVRIEASYLSPAPREGRLWLGLRVVRVGYTSLDVLCRLWANRTCFQARMTTVLCDDSNGRPVAWPDAVREKLLSPRT